MQKLLAVILSLFTAFTLYFGTAGSDEYIKKTKLESIIDSVANKNEILNTDYTGQISDEHWDISQKYSLEDTTILKKEKDKDFIILNLSDIHFTDYGKKAASIPNTIANIKKMVATVQPDLITVTGDIVCSDSTYHSVEYFTDLMESFGIPWAPVFGNHDGEGNCDLNYICDVMMTSPHCLLKKGDPELGIGNYIINIAEENQDGTLNVVESLIMVYSHNYSTNTKQMDWYTWAAEGIKEISGNATEISMFCHVPLAEYQYAYDKAWDSENNTWRDGFEAYGELNEKVAYGRDNNGQPHQKDFFSAIKNKENTKFIFCGHDHLNNFSILYEGIRLTYTMKIGIASGSEFHLNGGTVITVGDNGIENIRQMSLALGPVITLENINTK